jgi:hypothetical protein
LARRKESDRALRRLVVESGVKALIAEAEQDVRPRSNELVRNLRPAPPADRSELEPRWRQTRPREGW